MYLGTINGTDYWHINTSVEAKIDIKNISENPVDFVTEDKFNEISDQFKEKIEYVTYYNSMCTLLLLILSVVLLQSCSTSKRIPLSIETFYVEYGDPRWNDCKDIYVQEYSINIYGDTLPTRKIYSADCYEGKMKTFADKTIKNYGKVD